MIIMIFTILFTIYIILLLNILPSYGERLKILAQKLIFSVATQTTDSRHVQYLTLLDVCSYKKNLFFSLSNETTQTYKEHVIGTDRT